MYVYLLISTHISSNKSLLQIYIVANIIQGIELFNSTHKGYMFQGFFIQRNTCS